MDLTVEQYFEDAEGAFALHIDFETLTMRVLDHPSDRLAETFPTVEELDVAYRRRIAGLHASCTNICRESVAPIADLVAHHTELVACHSMAPPPPGAAALDRLVIDFANTLRLLLNQGLGAEPITLQVAVFCMDDFGIHSIAVNPPKAVGLSDPECQEMLSRHQLGGWFGDRFAAVGYSLEENAFGEALGAYGDRYNLYDPAVTALLYLVCARIEARPQLRANVEPADGLRVFFAFHDMEGAISFQARARAAAFVDEPAADYFGAILETARR